MKSVQVLVFLGLGFCACSSAMARLLLQVSPMAELEAMNMLMIPSNCKAEYTCPGEGPQIYTCNGTALVNTNSKVTMRCPAPLGAGVHNVTNKEPTYTFECGRMQGNSSSQLMFANPSKRPTDLAWYRREAINRSGCLDSIRYVTRTDVVGGQSANMSCSTANATQDFFYTATFTFYTCN